MKSPHEYACGLLEKAAHDLVAAEATIATVQALDTVCFHAQQATEKSLKALLASKDVVYPFRHDLGELIALAAPHFPAVSSMRDELLLLSPYAVAARYDDAVTPDIEEARSALATAHKMHELAMELTGSGGGGE